MQFTIFVGPNNYGFAIRVKTEGTPPSGLKIDITPVYKPQGSSGGAAQGGGGRGGWRSPWSPACAAKAHDRPLTMSEIYDRIVSEKNLNIDDQITLQTVWKTMKCHGTTKEKAEESPAAALLPTLPPPPTPPLHQTGTSFTYSGGGGGAASTNSSCNKGLGITKNLILNNICRCLREEVIENWQIEKAMTRSQWHGYYSNFLKSRINLVKSLECKEMTRGSAWSEHRFTIYDTVVGEIGLLSGGNRSKKKTRRQKRRPKKRTRRQKRRPKKRTRKRRKR